MRAMKGGRLTGEGIVRRRGSLQCDFWQLSVCQETLNKNHAGFEDSPAFTPQS